MADLRSGAPRADNIHMALKYFKLRASIRAGCEPLPFNSGERFGGLEESLKVQG